MAGAGVRLFTAGSILTASQVNDYLMDQVVCRFADAAARDAAFVGVGVPVLSEGRICYLDSDNKIYVYSGSAWVELALTVSGTAGQVVVYNSGGAPTATTLSGDVTVNSTGVTAISSGVIVNADVNASAAIDKTKISGTAVTLADTGTITSTMIENDTIINADIKSNAAIAYSKLSLSGSIVNADVNASAAIDKTKISGTAITAADTGTVTSTMITDGTIVNADINAAAAIDLGKLADSTILTKTSNHTLVLTDKNKFIEMNIAGAPNTVSVPTDASVNFPTGSQINITQYGTGKTQIVAVTPGTTSIRSTPGTYLRDRYSSATLIKRAANEWYLIGDLSAS